MKSLISFNIPRNSNAVRRIKINRGDIVAIATNIGFDNWNEVEHDSNNSKNNDIYCHSMHV